MVFPPLASERFGADLSGLQPDAFRDFAMAARLANLIYERARREWREDHPHRTRDDLAQGDE